MQAEIHQMMRAAVQAKKLNIEHMRNHGKGMPVRGDGLCKDGDDAMRRESLLHQIIACHVGKIIIVVEFKVSDRAVGDQGCKGYEHDGRRYLPGLRNMVLHVHRPAIDEHYLSSKRAERLAPRFFGNPGETN